MTSPIKPPGSGAGPRGPDAPGGPGAPREASGPSQAFQEALEATETAGRAGSTRSGDAVAGPADLAEGLRAGRLDVALVVDALVGRAMARPEVALLDAAGRVELEAHLRRTLADDPNLSAMVEDLERGR